MSPAHPPKPCSRTREVSGSSWLSSGGQSPDRIRDSSPCDDSDRPSADEAHRRGWNECGKHVDGRTDFPNNRSFQGRTPSYQRTAASGATLCGGTTEDGTSTSSLERTDQSSLCNVAPVGERADTLRRMQIDLTASGGELTIQRDRTNRCPSRAQRMPIDDHVGGARTYDRRCRPEVAQNNEDHHMRKLMTNSLTGEPTEYPGGCDCGTLERSS